MTMAAIADSLNAECVDTAAAFAGIRRLLLRC
jgi:hypothetical protein